MLNFILTLCAVFAIIVLTDIAIQFQKTRSAIEDLVAEIDELNMNVRELSEPKN